MADVVGGCSDDERENVYGGRADGLTRAERRPPKRSRSTRSSTRRGSPCRPSPGRSGRGTSARRPPIRRGQAYSVRPAQQARLRLGWRRLVSQSTQTCRALARRTFARRALGRSDGLFAVKERLVIEQLVVERRVGVLARTGEVVSNQSRNGRWPQSDARLGSFGPCSPVPCSAWGKHPLRELSRSDTTSRRTTWLRHSSARRAAGSDSPAGP